MNIKYKKSLRYAGFLLASGFFIFSSLIYLLLADESGNDIAFVSIIAFFSILIYFGITRKSRRRRKVEISAFPPDWKKILEEKVAFYRGLDDQQKRKFEQDVLVFLDEKKITGVDVEIDDTDRLLVASSAVIPVFGFDEWEYHTLDEVLVYPGSFRDNFETSGGGNILGMVGTGGSMDRVMILSKPALRQGFRNSRDKNNTAIHEFIHLIDKADGSIDGVPAMLLENQYMIPWIEAIDTNIQAILDKKSDIRAYGAYNRQEFFAVVSEYFFERPEILERKHPELYKLLDSIFRQDVKAVLKKTFHRRKIGRNAPCPCGSGKKYKQCCLKKTRKKH